MGLGDYTMSDLGIFITTICGGIHITHQIFV